MRNRVCIYSFALDIYILKHYMTPNQALLTLHTDYIGGQHANYQKLYFATQLDLDNAVRAMHNMSQYNWLRQSMLYLLCWGEAAQVDDYYRSPECQTQLDSVPEDLYLLTVVKPLYHFIHNQGYEVVNNKFVHHERNHANIIGYDDINQLFWERVGNIILTGSRQ
ncbi:hypothetical protein BU17DRAFT_77961 [Hysterangium stoloniferum]|nr:hypothetical protein BU17DRAFT_77961 [Hysterangium stoloniferum]